MKFLQLTDQWWQLLWLFGAGFLFMYHGCMQKERVLGKNVYRWRLGPAILLALPYAIWAGTRRYVGDTELYIKNFKAVPGELGELISYVMNSSKDVGYVALSGVSKILFGDSFIIFFTLIALFQMGCLVYVYRKYSKDYFICMFLFIASTDYISWMHNGMRQFIAATMITACLELMIRKKYVPLIIVILIASTIHGSALMMLPIIFIIQGKPWNKKTLLFIAAIMVVILYIDQFTPILDTLLTDTQYDGMLTNELWSNDDGANLIRVAVYSVPALMSLVGLRYVNEANDPVINICVNCAVVTMALYLLAAFTSGIYIGRLPIYTSLLGYITLPWLIENMFTKESARFMNLAMVGAYLLFFYYQMHFTWGML